MLGRFRVILLNFCFISAAYAQNIDSLKLELATANHDTTRCNILSNLVEVEYDIAIWPLYNEQLLTLSEKNAKLTTNVKLKIFYLKHYSLALNNFGYLAALRNDNYSAVDYYLKGIDIQEKIGDKVGVGTSYINIGTAYYSLGNVPMALEFYYKGLKVQEELNNQLLIAYVLNNLGIIYDEQGDYEKALELYTKSGKMEMKYGTKEGVVIYYNNIGSVYVSKGNLNKALECHQKGLKLAEEINDQHGISLSLNNIGFVYSKKGDLNKAFDYYQKCLTIREQLDDKSGLINPTNNSAEILLMQNKTDLALAYANKAYAIAKEIKSVEKIGSSAAILNKIYKMQNKFKEAYEMYELEIKMRDSILNEENRKANIQQQFKYEYEKKSAADSVSNAKERQLKDAEIAKGEAELKVKENQQIALFGGLILLVVFALLMYNRFRITRKQKYIIELQKNEVHKQKELVEEKHKEITDSINYAERIQRSFLASKSVLDFHLKDYFVFFKPKDVVSGDFYWATELKNGNFAFSVADSTGHGVPGAIMSILNISSLEKAIEIEVLPHEILNTTRKTIIERLKKDGSVEGGKDGMDCSLIVLNPEKNYMYLAAAQNPVWLIRNHELIEFKGDKMPVGKHEKDTISFSMQESDLQRGDVLYLMTDGFSDQFGGGNKKKYMSKKLKEFLLSISPLPMKEQEQKIIIEFNTWKGDHEQIDDVCIIGVRL